ncbi:NADH dehydrogenase (quinone) subunit D [Leptospira interrogans]|uniref:NADH-quinone oxidoreductase subunit D n=1 Tax=Leptospira interrogans serovar Pomona TaxID=44276 RepID=A0AA40WA35_LEPIR|nr:MULTISPECIES: NADH dehydrogenase (quinone) subunit D [Leptospira]EJO80031.1 NADH dehydrogenase subunit D [Leptospira interrogans serovar Pomona str. Kennewicki LC82-25]EKN96087.1 NADH dehydrogenase subunit D [Leptospira interrogans serovar Pomona str. Pomona]EKR83685.1 NADH dehydrogenase subunit D [Leptospira interrogans str. UI 08452]EMF32932.1 NADH dehydrogenase subunit D [Leptospira interrogans serovar Pomona str. Fox 32256]EMJ60697.1 NADH dehydrogenase subunit D [Leptospira interrogans 
MMYEKTAEHFEQKYKNLPEGHLLVNLGPSHPATHGILQNVIQIDGERIVEAESVIGYVHRCFEKLGEHYTYNQFLVCTDRMNYVSTPLNNIGWILAVEKMMQIEVPDRVTYVRMIISELSRIIDHIICTGILGVDLGAFSGMLHLFHHRENIYQIIEKLTGARLTTTFCRIGGLEKDIYPDFVKEVKLVCKGLKPAIEEFNSLLLKNKIFLGRTEGIGGISAENAIAYGYTGPNLRAAGVDWDVRKDEPYLFYDKVDFDIPIGEDGSVLHRSLVRMEEMRQSIRIIEQLVDGIPSGPWHADLPHAYLPEKHKVYNNMEELIYHFKIIMHGVKVPPGEYYMATEAANGELGFYIVSEGEKSPWRVHVRRPCFWYYQSFAELVRGGLLADSVATMSSLNVIAGELDC